MVTRLAILISFLAFAASAQTIHVTDQNLFDLNPETGALTGLVGAHRVKATFWQDKNFTDPFDVTAGLPLRLTITSRADDFQLQVLSSVTASPPNVVWWVIPFLDAGEYELTSVAALPGDSVPVFDRYLTVTGFPTTALSVSLTVTNADATQFGYVGGTNVPGFVRLFSGDNLATGVVDGANLSLFLKGGDGFVANLNGVATGLVARSATGTASVSLVVTNSTTIGTGIRIDMGLSGINAGDAIWARYQGTNVFRVTSAGVIVTNTGLIASGGIATPAITAATVRATGRVETDSYRDSMGVEIYNAAQGPLDNRYQQYGAPSWHPNLVAWWRADGRPVDDSGNTNHATWTGTAAYTNGRMGGAFRTINNGLTAPNSPTLVITNALSLSAWIWQDAHPVSFASPASLWSATGNQRSYGFFMSAVGDPELRWQLNSDGTSASTIIVAMPTALETGRWYHIVGTYIPGTEAAIWVDGVKVSTNLVSGVAVPASLHPSTASFSIGGSTVTAVPAWNGCIDDVRVYNIALTTSNDIRSVMLGLQPLTMSP